MNSIKNVKKVKKKGGGKVSGYNLFGRDMKDEINKKKDKKEESGDKVKYIDIQSKMWGELTDEEKGEWKDKAKVVNQQKEQEHNDKEKIDKDDI